MARHALAFKLWRSVSTLCHQLRSSRNHSSLLSSDSFLSRRIYKSSLRSLSSSHSVDHLGFARKLGLEYSNAIRRKECFVAPWQRGEFRHASTAAREESKPAEKVAEGITLTDSCIRRIQEIKREDGLEGENKMLRLSVEGGGCSGFLYNFALDDKVNKDDRVFESDGAKLVVDDISFGFIKGATVDFTEELIRASFAVTINPNAASACGCGASFNAK